MSKYTIDELKEHHYRCNGNREDLKIHERAGCFCCLKIFPASEVIHFVGDGYTAHCPKCDIDSVIVDDGVNEFSPELLSALQYEYFEKEPDWNSILNNPASTDGANDFVSLFEAALQRAAEEDTPPHSGEAAS